MTAIAQRKTRGHKCHHRRPDDSTPAAADAPTKPIFFRPARNPSRKRRRSKKVKTAKVFPGDAAAAAVAADPDADMDTKVDANADTDAAMEASGITAEADATFGAATAAARERGASRGGRARPAPALPPRAGDDVTALVKPAVPSSSGGNFPAPSVSATVGLDNQVARPSLSVLEQVSVTIRAAGRGSEEAWVRTHFEATWRTTGPKRPVRVTKVVKVAFGNGELWDRFETYARTLDAGPYTVESLARRQLFSGRQLALLWHGTVYCDAICKEGFRQCMSKSGTGIWFATHSCTSMTYAHGGEMLLSLVAVGSNGQGSGFCLVSGGVVVVYDDHAAIPMFRVIFEARK